MKFRAVPALAVLMLTSCAAPESGIRDPQRFQALAERQVMTSGKSPASLAACFQQSASLLPSSTLLLDPASGGATYTLSPFGFTFEQILFQPAGQGTSVTVLLAPGVNQNWRTDFQRDRLAPLRACLGKVLATARIQFYHFVNERNDIGELSCLRRLKP